MTVSAIASSILDLPTVALSELDAVAALQTRTDRKYIVAPETIEELISHLPGGLRALTIDDRRVFSYESVYFDTPALRCYYDAARRRPRRFKVRTRTYLDSGRCTIELKHRDARGRTVKERRDHEIEARREIAPAIEFLTSFPALRAIADELVPTLTTSYRRSTLLVGDDEGRATIDGDVTAVDERGRRVDLSRHVLIETKANGRPTQLDRVLWQLHVRPIRISKYCTSLAALHTDLPAHPWHRTLARLTTHR
jgi:hypothetical protein